MPCRNTGWLGAEQIHISQIAGRAQVELTQPDRAGHAMEIEYGDQTYIGTFDQNGRARVGFILTEAIAEFIIRLNDAPPMTCEVEVPDFDQIFRVVLRWHEPVQLDLTVIEPGGKVGDIGHINTARPNTLFTHGIGYMDLVNDIPAEGGTAELSYVVPAGTVMPAIAAQAQGDFHFQVEYISRGLQPEAPYCDDHPLAVAHMELITIEKGKVTTRKLRTNHARCGEAVAGPRRFISVR